MRIYTHTHAYSIMCKHIYTYIHIILELGLRHGQLVGLQQRGLGRDGVVVPVDEHVLVWHICITLCYVMLYYVML